MLLEAESTERLIWVRKLENNHHSSEASVVLEYSKAQRFLILKNLNVIRADKLKNGDHISEVSLASIERSKKKTLGACKLHKKFSNEESECLELASSINQKNT